MNGYVLKRLKTLKDIQSPVVFGAPPTSRKKGSTMKFENSRYAKSLVKPARKRKNPWREVVLSEANLIDGLTFTLRQHTVLKPSEVIERVIVGEPVNGQYPLSVSIVNKKEVADQENGS